MSSQHVSVHNSRAILCFGILQSVIGVIVFIYAITVLASLAKLTTEASVQSFYGLQLFLGALFVIAGSFGVISGKENIDTLTFSARTYGNRLATVLVLSVVGFLLAVAVAIISYEIMVEVIAFGTALAVSLGQIVSTGVALRNVRRNGIGPDQTAPSSSVGEPLMQSFVNHVGMASEKALTHPEDYRHFRLTLPNDLL